MGDSPDSTDAPVGAKGPDRPYLQAALGCLVVAGTLLTFFVVLPFGLLAFAFWAAEQRWDFERDHRFYYWLFVKGSRVESFGLVAPNEKTVQYSFRGSDGNFPGWGVVSYESGTAPDEIIDAYAKRCENLKAKVTERKVHEPKDGKIGIHLECEFKDYLTAEFFAERAPSDQVSKVGLRIWGQK